MTRPLLAACLLATSVLAHAEWRHLADSALATMSYDTATTRTPDGKTRLKYRLDFKEPRKTAEGKAYASSTMNVAVDCNAHTVTLLDFTAYAAKSGTGDVVQAQSFPNAAADKVSPTSSNEVVYDAACGKVTPPEPKKGK